MEPAMIYILLSIGVLVQAATLYMALRKGYHPGFWFLAGGVIGLIVLSRFPAVNNNTLPVERRRELKRDGNLAGGLLSAVFILVGLATGSL